MGQFMIYLFDIFVFLLLLALSIVTAYSITTLSLFLLKLGFTFKNPTKSELQQVAVTEEESSNIYVYYDAVSDELYTKDYLDDSYYPWSMYLGEL